jgi:hypothetical protein
MVLFAALSLTAIGFVYRYLPETKHKSVEEITRIFEDQAGSGRPTSRPAAQTASA